jgi:hypothetical protein
MGGPGSGRWYRWDAKDTVEGCRRLDVRVWQRGGFLRPGGWFSWAWWNRDGVQVASINVQVLQAQVRLSYRVRRGSEPWQKIEEAITLTWTPCHYGGQRPWFRCPGWRCDRRVAMLYLGGGTFRCRYCLALGYESQRETPAFRLLAKAQNIRLRLGGSASLAEPFPSKPKGMHGRTYVRLWWRAQEAGWGSMHAMLAHLERRTSPRAQ